MFSIAMIFVLIAGIILSVDISECKLVLLHGNSDGRQQYTWLDAYKECRKQNGYLATNTTGLGDGDKQILRTSRAWVGKIKVLSKWMKIVGCGEIHDTTESSLGAESEGTCEWKCRTFKYFASDAMTDRDYKSCRCLTKLPDLFPNAQNCFSTGTYTYMTVFSRINQTVKHKEGKGNCMVNSCKANDPLGLPKITSCNSNLNGHGVCVMESTCYRVGENELPLVIEVLKLYRLKNLGNNFTIEYSKQRTLFTNMASIEHTFLTADDIDSIPEKCAALEYEKNILVLKFLNCNETLPYFTCAIDEHNVHPTTGIKKKSTAAYDMTKRNTTTGNTIYTNMHRYTTKKSYFFTKNRLTTGPTKVVDKMQQNDSDDDKVPLTGLIIGLVVGAILVVATVCILIFIYKKRNSTETKRRSGIKRHFHNEAYNDASEATHSTHEALGLQSTVEESSGMGNQEYAVVQKIKHKKDTNLSKTEETYNESPNDDYDHLNEIDKRRIRLSENTYDSNVGVRMISDPTYDTSQPRTRMRDNDNNIYDHFSQTSVVSSDNNYSSS